MVHKTTTFGMMQANSGTRKSPKFDLPLVGIESKLNASMDSFNLHIKQTAISPDEECT